MEAMNLKVNEIRNESNEKITHNNDKKGELQTVIESNEKRMKKKQSE